MSFRILQTGIVETDTAEEAVSYANAVRGTTTESAPKRAIKKRRANKKAAKKQTRRKISATHTANGEAINVAEFFAKIPVIRNATSWANVKKIAKQIKWPGDRRALRTLIMEKQAEAAK